MQRTETCTQDNVTSIAAARETGEIYCIRAYGNDKQNHIMGKHKQRRIWVRLSASIRGQEVGSESILSGGAREQMVHGSSIS